MSGFSSANSDSSERQASSYTLQKLQSCHDAHTPLTAPLSAQAGLRSWTQRALVPNSKGTLRGQAEILKRTTLCRSHGLLTCTVKTSSFTSCHGILQLRKEPMASWHARPFFARAGSSSCLRISCTEPHPLKGHEWIFRSISPNFWASQSTGAVSAAPVRPACFTCTAARVPEAVVTSTGPVALSVAWAHDEPPTKSGGFVPGCRLARSQEQGLPA